VQGVSSKCRDFVKSCLICQKGGNKNTGFRAPLKSMPVYREAFEMVYVDLVGEIHPPLLRFIVGSCARLMRAPTSLKKIDSVSIAEALLSQFSIFGHLRKIICDNAANLTSDILKEIYRVYGIEIRQIPVYRPQANSVQERSHAHIKSILRKLCSEQPRQWHRYIDPLLFSIRTTENANRFTLFELLFGRRPRTHLDVLRDLWTNQNGDAETKTTYQYVLDLRNRIEETCKLAQEEIAKTHVRNKSRLDKNAKLRILKAGDKVLVLSPKPSNKLEFIWKGSAEVLERKGIVNYRIKLDNGKERVYHINMLKPFISRDSTDMVDRTLVTMNGQECGHTDDESEENPSVSAVKGLFEDSEGEGKDESSCKSEASNITLYNSMQKETWKDVKINPDLGENERKQL
jgi:hypothetical protein